MALSDFLKIIGKPHKGAPPARMVTSWGEAVDPDDLLQEYPRPAFVRPSYYNLNGIWQYAITSSPDIPPAPQGDILVPFSPESILSGVERTLQPDEYLWYMTDLPVLEPPFPDARLHLHFGAVDQICEIHVNDSYLCTHIGGYLPFTVDITDALHFTPSRKAVGNRLRVRVQDTTQTSWHARGRQSLTRGGMSYTAQSGIWQTVWLEWVPQIHLRGARITPEADLTSVTIRIETNVFTGVEVMLYKDKDAPAETFFTRGIGQTVPAGHEDRLQDLYRTGSDLKPCNVGGPIYVATLRLLLSDVTLWTPETPHLYGICIRVGTDEVRGYFAMRHCEIRPDDEGIPRFHLNHRPLFLNGVLDPGYWPDGLMTAPSDKALVFDISRMKALGFNMLRKHVKVETARWYYHCDRLGMLVMQDMVSGGASRPGGPAAYLPLLFSRPPLCPDNREKSYRKLSRKDAEGRAQWQAEMLGTIRHLCSSPSVIAWVLFHEGWGQFDAAEMTALAREEDPHRPIDQASGWFDQGGGDFLSIHNYFRKLKPEKDRYGRAILLSGFGGYACRIEGHCQTDQVFGYRRFETRPEFAKAFAQLMKTSVPPLIKEGLCGYVYTQLSDIEDEVNGLYTYDRKVCKIDYTVNPANTADEEN